MLIKALEGDWIVYFAFSITGIMKSNEGGWLQGGSSDGMFVVVLPKSRKRINNEHIRRIMNVL